MMPLNPVLRSAIASGEGAAVTLPVPLGGVVAECASSGGGERGMRVESTCSRSN